MIRIVALFSLCTVLFTAGVCWAQCGSSTVCCPQSGQPACSNIVCGSSCGDCTCYCCVLNGGLQCCLISASMGQKCSNCIVMP